jgi:hypothetical protein
VSDVPPPGGYPPQPPGGYQPPPAAPQPPQYQPPQYQQPQQPQYAVQPQQFQPVNPQASKSGNGCLKAFLIFMAISVVLGVIATVVFVLFIGKVVDEAVRTFGVADTKDYVIDIDPDSCKIDENSVTGSMEVSGTITNKANRRQAYNLTVDYFDNNDVKLSTDSLVYTGALEKDAKGKWSSSSFTSGSKKPDSIKCKVSQVNYWGS